jgi:hypothetical protein
MGLPPIDPVSAAKTGLSLGKLFSGAWRWMKWLFTGPSRTAALEAQASGTADPRPTCLACGQAKVGVDERRVLHGQYKSITAHYGRCPSCKAGWRLKVSADGVALIDLQEPEPQQPRKSGGYAGI